MRISEIKSQTIADFARITPVDEETLKELDIYKRAAISYIKGQTGLKVPDLDRHEDITIAVLVLAADMYDNRSMYVDSTNLNKVVSSIIDMHSENLL